MTTFNASATVALPRGALAIHSIICAFENAVDAVAAWNRKRLTAAQLAKLTRAQLSDIGLEGVDLDDFAARMRG